MRNSVNRVELMGNLGADPDLKYTPSGKAVCNLRIATNETWKDKSGQTQTRTEWHRVTVWGKQAENCAKFLAKGRQVMVEGKLSTRMYEKDGQKHYVTEVVCKTIQFLGGKKKEEDSTIDEETGDQRMAAAGSEDIPY